MNTTHHQQKLVIYGLFLFLLGLFNGIIIEKFTNSRIGLSAHLAAVQNGMVLILFGLIWSKAQFSKRASSIHFYSCLYSMFGIWIALLLSAIWGTSKSTPIAGKGFSAEPWKESIIQALLISSSITIIISVSHLLWRFIQNYRKNLQ